MNNLELKKYLESNNRSGYKTRENHIREIFPELYVKIHDFSKSDNWHELLYNYVNKIIENPKCEFCGKTLHVKKYNLGYATHCSIGCINKSEIHKNKIRQTCISIYGVDNPSKSQTVKDKIKNRVCKNGVWYVETDEFKNKSKQTCVKKYGVDSYSKLDEYHEKVKKTSIKRYGVDSYNKTNESKELVKLESIKKYGTKSYLSTDEFKEKSKQTNMKKRGVSSHTKTEEYKTKMKKYYLKKYGVEYPTQHKEFANKMINTMIEKYGEIWINYIPKYNVNSIIYLDMISQKLEMPIQHALNGGEKKFIKYWVDGYVQEHNICIEWDEEHHNAKRQKERDNVKEKFLKENFSCIIIRINEKEFLKNIETSINNISGLIMKEIDK
jgi:hypothetical protein